MYARDMVLKAQCAIEMVLLDMQMAFWQPRAPRMLTVSRFPSVSVTYYCFQNVIVLFNFWY